MAVYYPQGAVTLRVVLEDFGAKTKAKAQNVHTFTAVAKQLTVNLNSYREADTFSCTLDFKTFPFDPRAIRSAGITIHVEDRKSIFKTDNRLNLLNPKKESIIFLGFVDTDKITMSEDSRIVELEGRDFTSLLLDRPYFGPPVPLTAPLDQVFQNLLNELDETRFNGTDNNGIQVVNQTGEDLPIMAKFGENKSAAKSGKKNGRPNRSYWDTIQKITNESGLITFISLDKLIISKPRVLYSDQKPKMFVYGGNVSNLSFERKLGRMKGINIRVLSFNGGEKKTLEAKIPLEATEEWAKEIGIPLKEITVAQVDAEGKKIEPEKAAPYLTFKVKNVKTTAELIKIGESVYEEFGRQQIEGKLTTKEMKICDTDHNVFNSTLMRIGTPIEIDINQGDLKGLPDFQKAGTKQAKKASIKSFLKARCYDEKIADAFADALTNFDTPFYTQEVEFKLDQESGWSMDISFVNFINLPRSLAGQK